MVHVAVDKNGSEGVYDERPVRDNDNGEWVPIMYGREFSDWVELPKGSIEKLIGRKLTWEDDAVKLT